MQENRPSTFNATMLWAIGPKIVSDRNRAEYRFRQAQDDFWRYRNLKPRRPVAKAGPRSQLQPYVADEIYYDFDAHERNQNRACGGLSAPAQPGFQNVKATSTTCSSPR